MSKHRSPAARRGGPSALVLAVLAAPLLLACGWLGPRPPRVTVKFVIYDNDNSFAATVYAQEVSTGATTAFAYGPHTPSMTVSLKAPGTYVFYARLVEAPDDYHYGFTGFQAGTYGHMTRGGTRDAAATNLIAVDAKAGGSYKVFISDNWAVLPQPGQPVTVPWHRG
jgi:hypothetical protein